MKFIRPPQFGWMAGSLALVLVLMSAATTARANVYATDIQVNGSLTSTNAAQGSPVSITYRLNQTADRGVTVNILQGTNVAAAIAGGTNMGRNSVSWTPNATGTFSVSITAAATGYTNWTQISVDTNAGMPAYYPQGIDVDKNTNSPYYGRVIMGCALNGGSDPSLPLAAQQAGLYKMNADGTQADEGWYGNAGYTTDDAGNTSSGASMPSTSPTGYDPLAIRIGDDDRIYWCDDSAVGAIIACDMQATTNQIVIKEAGYATNPDKSDLIGGIEQFDVTSTTTTNAALWLCDMYNDYPNWGIWMYHMKNGVADPADTKGTQAVESSDFSDLYDGSSGGCMVDTNLDIFVSQNTPNNESVLRTMDYTNWNHGVLPPEAGGTKNAYGTATGQVYWGVGTSDSTLCGVRDTVINSRTRPTMVALPMAQDPGASSTIFGVRVLNTANGSVVSVTNGATVQTLTNIDSANYYTCAAWDNVGNLYGASPTLQLWRVFSPPGSNQATTAALETVTVVPPLLQIVQVSNQFVAIDSGIHITNQASGANGPFTFSLSAGSRGHISTNGLFQWTPPCPFGSTTNAITVWVTDSGSPPQSNSMTFMVVVSECVEVSIGSSAVQTGSNTCVPVNLFTTINLTNLNFTLADPGGYFTNWNITASNSAIASATAQIVDSYHTLFNVGVENGQVLQGSNVIGSICLQAVPSPASAFVPLAPSNMGAAASNNSPVTHFTGQNGQVAVIGGQSLLGGYVDRNSNRVLTVYGNPGTTYEILTTTNIADPNSWSAAGAVTLSNLILNTNVGRTNLPQYYRAVQTSP